MIRRIYKNFVSPLLHTLAGPGFGCRFYPTCSDYAIGAVRRFGLIRGGCLALFRILRCQPFSKGGVDPVPESISCGCQKK